MNEQMHISQLNTQQFNFKADQNADFFYKLIFLVEHIF